MKKWLWLLWLPYVVVPDTTTKTWIIQGMNYATDGVSLGCDRDQRWICEDYAEALNAAHKRRIENDGKQAVSCLETDTVPFIVFDSSTIPCNKIHPCRDDGIIYP